VTGHSRYDSRTRSYRTRESRRCALDDAERERDPDGRPARLEAPELPYGPAGPYPYDRADDYRYDRVPSPHESSREFVSHGRPSAYRPGLLRQRNLAIAGVTLAVLITILVLALSGGGASWPSSVATVQAQADRACQNPNVASEPAQVNFACAPSTRQILWVFALLMSSDDPSFADATTGRMGLEPITPTQGGEVAWSLNLHHPYDPTNPVDSLEVAARAINNIIGGATLTGANGTPVVQAGLESTAGNCVRYTGSPALLSRHGFPAVCASPVSTLAGQAALVADVYTKWVVGTAPQAAQNAAVLFENSNNPGNPQVQAILHHLPGASSAG
jgi:hypothetical protein